MVIVEDEFTFYAPGKPLVNNDSIVTLTNLVTNQQYIINLCNGSCHFGNISENIYRVQISGIKFFKNSTIFFFKFDDFFANSTKSFCIYNNKGHSRIRNNLTVFISKQVVIFTFTVVPITVTDSSYTFTILATYDTQVPIPVITIMPLLIDVPQIDSRGATTITFTTITNHGLVAGQKAGLSFGSEFRLKLLVNPIGQ